MRRRLTFLLALLLCAPPIEARAQTPANAEDIFKKAFGARRAPARQTIAVPVVFEGAERGTIEVTTAADPDDVDMSVGPFLRLFGDIVQPETLAAIEASVWKEGSIKVGALRDLGIAADYDPAALILTIGIPGDLRRTQAYSLAPGARTPNGDLLPPAAVAAALNLRGNVEYARRPGDGAAGESGRRPARLSLDGFLDMGRWVFEGAAFFREDDDREWTRGDVRLVRDDVETAIRYNLGDIQYRTTGFQGFVPLGGFGFGREFSIRPYEITQPSGEQEFVLRSRSDVEVIVNGRVSRTFRMEPGRYRLGDFPGTSGANDIRLRIVDEFGVEQVIEIPFFFDSRLLATGLHEFGYAVGLPQSLEDGVPDYDGDRLSLSAFHRYGLNDLITLNGNVQADWKQQQLGAGAVLATPIGNFDISAAASAIDGVGYDGAARLFYRLADPSARTPWAQRSWNAAATYTGRRFAGLGDPDPDNETILDLSGRLNQPLTRDLSLSFGTRYQFSRGPETDDAHSQTAEVRYRVTPESTLDLAVDRSRHGDGTTELSAFLSFRIVFGDGRHSAGVTHDTLGRSQRLDWRYTPARPIGGLGADAQVTRTPTDHEVTGNLRYRGHRLEADLRHDVLTPRDASDGGTEHLSSLSFGTALVFADGHVGVSRPIGAGFALIAPHRRLAGQKIGIDPFEDGYNAESDFLGPAVVPDLTAYEYRTLLVEVPDAPFGYSLGELGPVVQPGFRGGTVVAVGTNATVVLGGTITASDGAPIGLAAGEIRPVGIEGQATTPFFTNRRGKFRVDGLRPGNYAIMLFGRENAARSIEIPQDAEGLLEFGAITM